jgi:hypothetical protein
MLRSIDEIVHLGQAEREESPHQTSELAYANADKGGKQP